MPQVFLTVCSPPPPPPLSQVIYALNTKNDEHEAAIATLKEAHEEEVQQILSETREKILQVDIPPPPLRLPFLCIYFSSLRPRCLTFDIQSRRSVSEGVPSTLMSRVRKVYFSSPAVLFGWKRADLTDV